MPGERPCLKIRGGQHRRAKLKTLINSRGGWTDSTKVKRIYCPCKGPRFGSQHPQRIAHKGLKPQLRRNLIPQCTHRDIIKKNLKIKFQIIHETKPSKNKTHTRKTRCVLVRVTAEHADTSFKGKIRYFLF